MEEGDEIIKEAREVITTEQLLYRKRKDKIEEAYNKYVEEINAKDMPPECKEILISPGRTLLLWSQSWLMLMDQTIEPHHKSLCWKQVESSDQ